MKKKRKCAQLSLGDKLVLRKSDPTIPYHTIPYPAHLCGGAPVGVRLPHGDTDVEADYTDECDQGRDVVHEEHDDHAEQGAEQADPLVVVLEAGAPPGGLGDAGTGSTPTPPLATWRGTR